MIIALPSSFWSYLWREPALAVAIYALTLLPRGRGVLCACGCFRMIFPLPYDKPCRYCINDACGCCGSTTWL
jgi:hypothetical protein